MKKWVAGTLVVTLLLVAILWIKGAKQEKPNKPVSPENTFMHGEEIQLTSSAFKNNGEIPVRYTCDDTHPGAQNISPPLEIGTVPAGTKSLALIMHDPDAPRAGGWTHWVKWNIPPETKTIVEGEEPSSVSGKGSGGDTTYQGPCPPLGTHRYFFHLYALDTELSVAPGSNKTELEWAMQGHTIGKGEVVGLYSRQK